jgi:hypothetical protein
MFFNDENSLVLYRIGDGDQNQSVRIILVDGKELSPGKQAQFGIAKRRLRDELIDGEGIVTKLWDGSIALFANRVVHILNSTLVETARCEVAAAHNVDLLISIQARADVKQILIRATDPDTRAISLSLVDPATCHEESYVPPSQVPKSASTIWSVGRFLIFRDGRIWVRAAKANGALSTKALLGEHNSSKHNLVASSVTSIALIGNTDIGIWNLNDEGSPGKKMEMQVPETPQGAMKVCSPGVGGLSEDGRRFALEFQCILHVKLETACGSKKRAFINIYDVSTPRVSECIPIDTRNGDVTFAISPSGDHIALFAESMLYLYELSGH